MELFSVTGQNFIGDYLFFKQKNKSHGIHVNPTTSNTTGKRKRKSRKPTAAPKTAIEYFPNASWSKFKILEGVGHFMTLESPDEVVAILTELLSAPTSSQII